LGASLLSCVMQSLFPSSNIFAWQSFCHLFQKKKRLLFVRFLSKGTFVGQAQVSESRYHQGV
jgi:hypothetical protein